MDKKTVVKYVLKGLAATLISAAAYYAQDALSNELLAKIKK